jgi:RNA-directed DNA polymerase
MRIADRSVLRLIRQWLEAAGVEPPEGSGGPPGISRQKQGTPQGGVISPLLANLYLHGFDKTFHRAEGPAHWAKAKLVRYADDFVVLAQLQTPRRVGWIETKLESWRGREINRDKTRVIKLRQKGESLDFLGYTFRYDRARPQGGQHRYLNVIPWAKALAREGAKWRELTSAQRNGVPIPQVIGELNRHRRGWANSFSYGYPKRAFGQINSYVPWRLWKHLRRRSQRPYRPAAGTTVYAQMKGLGLIAL